MRIRKGQARGGNASARGGSNSSAALAAATGSQDRHDKTAEFLAVEQRSDSSVGEKCENIPERVVVRSEAPPSLAALQTSANRSLTPPDRPYMNLDEFVNSLARKNCFPDEEFINPYSDHRHKTGESSGLINFSGPIIDDQSTPHFSRVNSGSSIKNADEVDTSLRLAISPRELAPAADPAKRFKGGNIVINTEEVVAGTLDDGRRRYCTTTVSKARIGSALEASETNIAHAEAYGQSYHTGQISSILESTEVEVEAGQPDQTMKSSTESLERRPRRASRSTGRKRGRLLLPAVTNDQTSSYQEQTDNVDQEEEASSDCSSQRAKTRKRKRKRSQASVSSSTLATQDSEKSKQRPGLRGSGAGESASKRTKTKKERKGSNARSGRPKKLKYMKQENTEELGNQCNRSDGKGWTCPLLAKTGYQLCDHHLDKLRCKPGSRSKYNKKKKKGAATLS